MEDAIPIVEKRLFGRRTDNDSSSRPSAISPQSTISNTVPNVLDTEPEPDPLLSDSAMVAIFVSSATSESEMQRQETLLDSFDGIPLKSTVQKSLLMESY
ncbi:hypothetical protein HK100_010672, partial [Physocladia obscura]